MLFNDFYIYAFNNDNNLVKYWSMGHRCFVPGYRGNYDNGPRVRVYSFPTDGELKEEWIRVIPRQKSKDNEIFKGKYDA